MGAGKFAALYFGSWFAIIILVAMLGQVAAIVYLVWLGFKLWLGYQRAANIGWRPYACLWVLLPFIGALVLACFKTGEGLKRKKVDESGSGMPKPKDPTDISNERKAYVIIAIILLATIAIVGDYYFGS
jgi:flagellar basal body-associated protein FliL